MNSNHTVKDWLEEAVPIALILAVWNLLAAIVPWAGLSTGLRWTGIAIALVYIVGRGWAHAEHLDPPAWSGLGDVVGNNVEVLTAAGAWFVASFVVYLFQWIWRALFRFANVGIPGPIARPTAWLGSALAATGLAVAVIFLIAAVLAIHRQGPTAEGEFALTSSNEGETTTGNASDDADTQDRDADSEDDNADTEADDADSEDDNADTEADDADSEDGE